jgi:hypothetical protein
VCLAHLKNCAKQKVGSVKNFKNTFFFLRQKILKFGYGKACNIFQYNSIQVLDDT